MAITLTIGGVDYTDALLIETLEVSDQLGQRNTASFSLKAPSGAYLLVSDDDTYVVDDADNYIGGGTRPELGATVELLNGATTIFAGEIDGMVEGSLAPGAEAVQMDIDAVDWNCLADRKLVAGVYETPSQTLGDIARDLVAVYLAGFGVTDTDVEDGPMVDRALWNYQTVAEALNELCEMTGYAWNIDYDKVLHVFARETNAAPFGLTESSANWRDMRVTRERSRYRNLQYVRAGTNETDTLSEALAGDGTRKVFTLGFPAATEPVIAVAGVSKTVGIGGLETGFDWYWNKGSTEIKQDDGAAAVTDGVVIDVDYTGMQPIQVAAQDDVELLARGTWEAIEDRPNIDAEDLASAVAAGLLRKFARTTIAVEFETDTDGLQAGQLISIEVPRHDLSGSYLIDSVSIADIQGTRLRYRVQALDGEALGGWEDFFRSLLRVGRKFVIRENETLLLLRSVTETVSLTDSVTATTTAVASSKWVVGTSELGYFEL